MEIYVTTYDLDGAMFFKSEIEGEERFKKLYENALDSFNEEELISKGAKPISIFNGKEILSVDSATYVNGTTELFIISEFEPSNDSNKWLAKDLEGERWYYVSALTLFGDKSNDSIPKTIEGVEVTVNDNEIMFVTAKHITFLPTGEVVLKSECNEIVAAFKEYKSAVKTTMEEFKIKNRIKNENKYSPTNQISFYKGAYSQINGTQKEVQ